MTKASDGEKKPNLYTGSHLGPWPANKTTMTRTKQLYLPKMTKCCLNEITGQQHCKYLEKDQWEADFSSLQLNSMTPVNGH